MLLGSIGRIKIYTDVEEITKDNVLSVLRKAYALHRTNAADMQMLIDYEAGDQPLPYSFRRPRGHPQGLPCHRAWIRRPP